ncbi:MAG: hypothetical protein LBU32_25165 [Clostridiales bacterium]|nr:hypothetical protein [Clostridiales bacterium]
MKNVLKTFLFLILLLGMLLGLNSFFCENRPHFLSYRKLSYGKLDVLVTGTDHMLSGFNTMRLWQEYGISSYVLANEAQPYAAAYLNILEALKSQRPKVIVIDAYSALYGESYCGFLSDKSLLYENFEQVPFSMDQVEVMWDLLPFWEFCEFYLPVYRNHSDWASLRKGFFIPGERDGHPFAGFDYPKFTTAENEIPALVLGETPMSPKTEASLHRVIQLCNQENITAIAVQLPYAARKDEAQDWYGKENYLRRFLENLGVAYFDSNALAGEMGFDYNLDMIDSDHLNFSGGVKFIDFFAKNLIEGYGLKDHKGEIGYYYWEGLEDEYQSYISAETGQ